MKELSFGICIYKTNSINVLDTEIFLIRPKGSTEFGFIKGKLEHDEPIKHCALRETLEETNIYFDINNLEDYFYQNTPRKFVGIFLIDYSNVDMSNIILQEREVQELVSFNISYDIHINKNQKEILKQIINKLILRKQI